MKTTTVLGIFTLVSVFATPPRSSAQLTSAGASPSESSTAWAVTERGADHKVWQRQTVERAANGALVTRNHKYCEIASGMHYKRDGHQGDWRETSEKIDILPGGMVAAATNGPHQVYLPADIYEGVIVLVGPDRVRQQSRPSCIGYYDGANIVFIAELTNSIGQLLPSGNQVIWTNCFTGGIVADCLATYRRFGFECDIVLRSKLPAPELLGISPNCRLQLFTEFLSDREPRVTPSGATDKDGTGDVTIEFGAMRIGRGKAFSLPDALQQSAKDGDARAATSKPSEQIPVRKSWVKLEDRTFLIEDISLSRIQKQLDQLSALAPTKHRPLALRTERRPPVGLNQTKTNEVQIAQDRVDSEATVRHNANTPSRTEMELKVMLPDPGGLVGAPCKLPASRPPAGRSAAPIQVAQANAAPPGGFVIDYIEFNSSPGTNFTFKGDTTYYISGYCYFANLTLEGGTVLKYAPGVEASVDAWGKIICKTAPYRPIILTARDDDEIGEFIAGSTSSPSGYYAYAALIAETGPSTIENVRCAHAEYGIALLGANTVRHCQFLNTWHALYGEGPMEVGNVLFSQVDTVFDGSMTPCDASHLTIHNADALMGSTFTLNITNSLFVNVTNWGSSFTGANNATNTGSGIFQTVGAGAHYLADSSPYRDVGTTNINPALLADLARRTTYPPLVCSNVAISANTTLSVQAQRDTDTPDLGYHFDPLDHVFGGVNLSANLTISPGTAIGWFEGTPSGWYGPGFGISIADASTLSFQGTATAPCRFARYTTAQECGAGVWNARSWVGGILLYGNSTEAPPTIEARFTHWMMLHYDPNHFRDYWNYGVARITACEFHGGSIYSTYPLYSFTNCLFDQTFVNLDSSYNGATCNFQNSSFNGGSLWLGRGAYQSPLATWTIKDTAFNSTDFYIYDELNGNTNYTFFHHNAFITGQEQLTPTGTSNVYAASFNWQSGPLGNFYLPPASPLVNAGSTNASFHGLYHFTTQTNQAKEEFTLVDCGYHYIAVDANGNPVDTDQDGLADYVEDANGNGVADNGETPWLPVPANPPSGLVAWYRAESNVLDVAGAHHGALGGGASFATGKVGLAFSLNGSDASVDLGNWFTLQTFTLALWVKAAASQATYANILDNNHTGSRGWVIQYNNTGLEFYWGSGPYGLIPFNLTADTWQFLVVTVDSNRVAKVYLDGELKGSATGSSPLYYDGTEFLRLGRWGGGGRYFNGLLDEVDIYSRALATNEIQAIFAAGVSGKAKIMPPFIGTHPASHAATLGGSATFAVAAGGEEPLTYQWRHNGSDIPGQNSATLVLANIQYADAGNYSVALANSFGSVTSSNAALAVAAAFYNAAESFSTNSNPNGDWSYGFSSTLGGAMTLYADRGATSYGILYWRSNVAYEVPSVSYNPGADVIAGGTARWKPRQLAFHPGPGGQFSIIRFTIPEAGYYELRTIFSGIDLNGTSTDVHVQTNGVSLFNGSVWGYESQTGQTNLVALSQGDLLDFVVGDGNNGYSCDTTAIDAIVAFLAPAAWFVQHWGTNYLTDPNAALDADPDGDSLTNLQEYGLGTDPTKWDTDGDGISDYDEVWLYHTDPNTQDSEGAGIVDQPFRVLITHPSSFVPLP